MLVMGLGVLSAKSASAEQIDQSRDENSEIEHNAAADPVLPTSFSPLPCIALNRSRCEATRERKQLDL
jgi:hypothetical protein